MSRFCVTTRNWERRRIRRPEVFIVHDLIIWLEVSEAGHRCTSIAGLVDCGSPATVRAHALTCGVRDSVIRLIEEKVCAAFDSGVGHGIRSEYEFRTSSSCTDSERICLISVDEHVLADSGKCSRFPPR